MSINRTCLFPTLLLLLFCSLIAPQSRANSVGIGFGGTTQYKGGSHYRAIPLASFSFDTRIGIVANEQIGVKIDLIKSRRVDTGPILRYQGGRDNDISDSVVAKLPELAATVEAGWFLGSGIPLSVLGLKSDNIITAKISGVTDIGDGHGGSTITTSTALVIPASPTVRIITSLSLSFSDKNYHQAFYGISETAAANSELPAFNASAGLESVGLGLIIVKQLSKKWSLSSITSLSELQADAAKSPITKRGSSSQLFMGAVFTYQL